MFRKIVSFETKSVFNLSNDKTQQVIPAGQYSFLEINSNTVGLTDSSGQQIAACSVVPVKNTKNITAIVFEADLRDNVRNLDKVLTPNKSFEIISSIVKKFDTVGSIV